MPSTSEILLVTGSKGNFSPTPLTAIGLHLLHTSFSACPALQLCESYLSS